MVYGFSFVGFFFFLFFLGPSFYWVRLPGYDCFRTRKKWMFRALERVGITCIFCTSLIFRNFEYRGLEPALALLLLAVLLLLLYEVHWIFCVKKASPPLVLFHVPMTVLPVLAYLCLAAYGKSLWLFLAALVFGIGHVFGMGELPDDSPGCCCCSGDYQN